MNINLRPEQPNDFEGITRVNDLSFQRKAEGKLVGELRKLKDFDPGLSIVAESDIVLFPIFELRDNSS